MFPDSTRREPFKVQFPRRHSIGSGNAHNNVRTARNFKFTHADVNLFVRVFAGRNFSIALITKIRAIRSFLNNAWRVRILLSRSSIGSVPKKE